MNNRSKGSTGRARSGALPVENDWVYTCPTGLATSQIAAALGATDQPVTEVSAHHWQEDWQMANTLMEAYGYPTAYWFQPGRPVGWNSLEDWILIKTWQNGPDAHWPLRGGRFVGELLIIRQSQDAAEHVLAFLLDIAQAHVRWSLRHHSRARIIAVLEGWERPILAGRVGKRVAWVVNPLPPIPVA